MGVENTDLGRQLGARQLGARLWRLKPGQASTRGTATSSRRSSICCSRGRGRMRVDDDLLTLGPLDTVLVEPDSVRQVFNDTAADQLWFVAGAPLEVANTLEMTPEQLAALYPDGPKALPPELG
jgi:quercetin dioxygenase-like cupin family protein